MPTIKQTSRVAWLAGIIILLMSIAPVSAQEFAMSVTIVQAGVEINRSNTDIWIRLQEGAVTPFGAGDRLRTDRTGRALLAFNNGESTTETLILPLSSLEILSFVDEGGARANLHMLMTGRSIHAVADPGVFASYQLDAGQVVVTEPSARFGVQTNSEDVVYLVSAEGRLGVALLDGETISVEGHTGLRVRGDEADPLVAIAEDVPINFARIEAELDGCPGTIQTANDVLLRVRAGPGDDFFYMGSIPDNSPIQLMGTAPGPGGRWYRFQFLSDFGWALGAAIETACTGLTEYPSFGVENAPGIVQVQDFEMPLLEPFFGVSENDVWFFRQ